MTKLTFLNSCACPSVDCFISWTTIACTDPLYYNNIVSGQLIYWVNNCSCQEILILILKDLEDSYSVAYEGYVGTLQLLFQTLSDFQSSNQCIFGVSRTAWHSVLEFIESSTVTINFTVFKDRALVLVYLHLYFFTSSSIYPSVKIHSL